MGLSGGSPQLDSPSSRDEPDVAVAARSRSLGVLVVLAVVWRASAARGERRRVRTYRRSQRRSGRSRTRALMRHDLPPLAREVREAMLLDTAPFRRLRKRRPEWECGAAGVSAPMLCLRTTLGTGRADRATARRPEWASVEGRLKRPLAARTSSAAAPRCLAARNRNHAELLHEGEVVPVRPVLGDSALGDAVNRHRGLPQLRARCR